LIVWKSLWSCRRSEDWLVWIPVSLGAWPAPSSLGSAQRIRRPPHSKVTLLRCFLFPSTVVFFLAPLLTLCSYLICAAFTHGLLSASLECGENRRGGSQGWASCSLFFNMFSSGNWCHSC
jgi:hypothetical protein